MSNCFLSTSVSFDRTPYDEVERGTTTGAPPNYVSRINTIRKFDNFGMKHTFLKREHEIVSRQMEKFNASNTSRKCNDVGICIVSCVMDVLGLQQ